MKKLPIGIPRYSGTSGVSETALVVMFTRHLAGRDMDEIRRWCNEKYKSDKGYLDLIDIRLDSGNRNIRSFEWEQPFVSGT